MRVVIALLLLVALGACSDDGTPSDGESSGSSVSLDTALRDELIAMAERDQVERTGAPDEATDETDEDRIARLKEIIAEHGWPTFDLVGRKAGDAAWLIAQHADLDPMFQSEALELLRAAVEDGQASPGNLAYLEDRVAVAEGRPQNYGTQVRCGRDGPVPTTDIVDEAAVEKLRRDAGLDPLADYLDEMAEVCAQDG